MKLLEAEGGEVNWYLAVETEDLFVFVNRVTGEVIVWEVDNA